MKALVLTGDGVNCESETARALEEAGIPCEISQISDFENCGERIHDYTLLALPGGFSYGDDLGSGKVFAKKIEKIFGNEIKKFVADKKPIIGICNGFQVLCTLKLLNSDNYQVALEHNDSGKFINKWVELEVPASPETHCMWTKGISSLRLPIRHGEGKLVVSKKYERQSQLEALRKDGRVALTYVENPNGSLGSVAGLTDETGLIFGLMPHPEAATKPWHYPGGSENQKHLGDELFKNAFQYLQENFS